MKIIIDAKKFGEGIKKIMPALPRRTPVFVLENILFRYNSGEIEMMTSNMEMMQLVALEAQGDGAGAALIPGRLLDDLISSLTGNIELNFGKDKLAVKTEKGKYQLSISNVIDDFPTFPHFDGITAAKTSSIVLREGIEFVKHFMSKEDIRPAMHAILLEETETEMALVATDGRVLSKFTIAGNFGHRNIVIPFDSISALEAFINDVPDEFIDVFFDGKMVKIAKPHEIFITRVIGEKFPTYGSVIPKENDKRAEVRREDIIKAIKRMQIISDKENNKIAMEFKAGKLTVSASNSNYGADGKETYDCKYNDEDFRIAFNTKLLFDCLAIFKGERITIEMKKPTTAIIIKSDEDMDNFALLMPVREDA